MEKRDISSFSPRLQEFIQYWDQRFEAERRKHETDIQYLRRVRPNWDDGHCLHLLYLCMILGKNVREACPEIE